MKIDLDILIDGILNSNLSYLSRAISIVESSSDKYQDISAELLERILPYTGNSKRIAISGSPGVGKSTFIETLGLELSKNNKLAVLAIDPSSELSKGSILGDKTRMSELTKKSNVFIRPTPSSGKLGGVANKTREIMLLCEAAAYNYIFIETVGVGQSETQVKSMTDLFLLLILPGGGDELQGIKKGIVEIADIIIINKSDVNLASVNKTQNDFKNAIKLIGNDKDFWNKKVLKISSLTGDGLEIIIREMNEYFIKAEKNEFIENNRSSQNVKWMNQMLKEAIYLNFVKKNKFMIEEMSNKVKQNLLDPSNAVKKLLEL